MINILLAFLSPVQLKDGDIAAKEYPELIDDGLGKTLTTNESGLRFVMKSLRQSDEKLDYYICLVSKMVHDGIIKNDNVSFNKTHFGFIKERTQNIFDKYYGKNKVDIDEVITKINYIEDIGNGNEIILKPIINAVSKIKEIQRLKPNEKINIYIDLTGGPRDANMMLFIMSRILDYDSDITVKQVIYSALNRDSGHIQLLSTAYDLLELVAGISEFANFGSMKSLNNYFSLNKINNESLQNLLAAMSDFSEKVQLCRYGEFTKSIEHLNQKVYDFKKKISEEKFIVDENAETVFLFLDEIDKKYRDLFDAVKNKLPFEKDLKLIRWCIKNDYIQQAMTLITERMPECFFNKEKPILTVPAEYLPYWNNGYDEYKKDNKGSFNYWLFLSNVKCFNEFEESGFKSDTDVNNYLVKASMAELDGIIKDKNFESGSILKETIENIQDKYVREIVYNKAIDNLKELHLFYSESEKKLYNREKDKSITILENVFRELSDELEKKGDSIQKFNGGAFPLKKLLKGLAGSGQFYNIKFNLSDIIGVKIIHAPRSYDNMRGVINKGWIDIVHGKEMTLKALLLYFEIKEERNAVNHAHNKNEKITFEQLKVKINEFLDLVEALL